MRKPWVILVFAGLLALEGCLESSGRQVASPAAWQELLSKRLAYLVKDESLNALIKLDPTGIEVFASVADRQAGRPEFQLFPQEYEAFKNLSLDLDREALQAIYVAKGVDPWPGDSLELWEQRREEQARPVQSGLPLQGYRIALDPGHIAADPILAELEGKFVKMRPSPQTGHQDIFLLEPNLTLATAHLLREMLEEAGAKVYMTRTDPGIGALGITYDAWRKEHFEGSLEEALSLKIIDSTQAAHLRSPEAKEKEVFSWVFNQLDLRARADRINAFRPHLTLMIHYNVDLPNWMLRDEESFLPPGQANYNMAFVPGSFMEGELEKQEDRLAFLRILFSDDWEQSVALSDRVLSRFTQKLKVPVVSPQAGLSYLENASVPTDKPGVYARNLTLTRMVKGPVCYGESLCQDHIAEARILSRNDLLVNGLPASHRVKEVAEAYFEGVMDYLRKQR